MKRRLSIMLMGVLGFCMSSFAMPPYPSPVVGESCIGTYPAATDPGSINFCGCYAGSAESTCNGLHEPGCTDFSPQLAQQVCAQISREGGLTNFCTNEHNEAPTLVITANCIADLTIICGTSSSGTGICNPCWSNQTCYTVGA